MQILKPRVKYTIVSVGLIHMSETPDFGMTADGVIVATTAIWLAARQFGETCLVVRLRHKDEELEVLLLLFRVGWIHGTLPPTTMGLPTEVNFWGYLVTKDGFNIRVDNRSAAEAYWNSQKQTGWLKFRPNVAR